MKFSWHGQSCFKIRTESGVDILIDPFITGNRLSDLEAGKVPADYIILTHAHNDHVGDTAQIAQRTGATIIANVELAAYFEAKGLQTHGMQPGGKHVFDFGIVHFTPAIHSSDYTEESGKVISLGIAAGVVLEIDGQVIYHAGDTALFSDIKLIGQLHELDYALLPIGDNFTMGPKEAAIAAEWSQATYAIPIHYDTFPLIEQDPADFVAELKSVTGYVAEIGKSIEP